MFCVHNNVEGGNLIFFFFLLYNFPATTLHIINTKDVVAYRAILTTKSWTIVDLGILSIFLFQWINTLAKGT